MQRVRVCLICLNNGKVKGCKHCGRKPKIKGKTLQEQRKDQCTREREAFERDMWEWQKAGIKTGYQPLDDYLKEKYGK